MVASAMAPHLSKELGVPVKVVNKPGGGAVLATYDLVKSRPDGHTPGVDLHRSHDHPGPEG